MRIRNTQFNETETFRDTFTASNSKEAILRFPFPFHEDSYMYSVNIEPAISYRPGSVYEFPIDVDEHYVAELRDRALVLDEDPLRYQALPHMMPHQWDFLELIMESMSESYPDLFTLNREGNKWHWINKPLNIEQHFIFGDDNTLPYEPMEYMTRQCQGDFVIMDQRDGTLWMDAGMITTQADWSLDFDIGMNFHEWHMPVPLAHEMGIFDAAQRYLMNLRLGQPVRRLNWTLTVNPLLDTSPENYHRWGPSRDTVTADNAGEKVHLRVELQVLWRLPRQQWHCFLYTMLFITYE